MVNINQINESIQSLGTATSKASTSDDQAGGFENALSRAIGQSGETAEGTDAVNALEEIASSYVQIQDSSLVVSEKTGELLDLLETYIAQLEDPEVSLKNLSEVIEQMNTDASSLLTETHSLTQEDEGLKDIATQTAATIKGEYLKFQRGDYL